MYERKAEKNHWQKRLKEAGVTNPKLLDELAVEISLMGRALKNFYAEKKAPQFSYHVHAYGDSSVGLPDFNIDVVVKDITLTDLTDPIVDGKEILRRDLEKFWSEWADAKAKITFDDDRPEQAERG